jgi:bifunctional DNase/RNase
MTHVSPPSLTCQTAGCSNPAVFHLAWSQFKQCQREQHLCEEHAQLLLSNHNFHEPVGVGEPAAIDGATCFDIDLVIVAETHHEQVVYLREVGGTRFFPILIGIFEATCLDRNLKGFQPPRPLTHDALADAIDALGGEVQDILISRVENYCYFTDLRIRHNGELVLVDMRPSDAFILAVIENKPIFVSNELLAKIGL